METGQNLDMKEDLKQLTALDDYDAKVVPDKDATGLYDKTTSISGIGRGCDCEMHLSNQRHETGNGCTYKLEKWRKFPWSDTARPS